MNKQFIVINFTSDSDLVNQLNTFIKNNNPFNFNIDVLSSTKILMTYEL